ncbi:MAG: hypothetical protein WCG07_01505 [Candidatus Taylorbacteria bacterium]
MRHTLLPTQQRIFLHHEYHVRLFIVFLFIFSAVGIIGAISLFPAFMEAVVEENSALEGVATIKDIKPDTKIVSIKKDLALTKDALVGLDNAISVPRLSRAIQEVISARSGVSITSVSVTRTAPTTSIVVQGFAPTRSILLAFQSKIQSTIPDATIDLPAEQLINSTDINFSVKITTQLK